MFWIVYFMIMVVIFKMNWGDLCFLFILFKECFFYYFFEYKGYKDIEYYYVLMDRIILINRD